MNESPKNQEKAADPAAPRVRQQLEAALELSEDEDVRYHLREALHLLEV